MTQKTSQLHFFGCWYLHYMDLKLSLFQKKLHEYGEVSTYLLLSNKSLNIIFLAKLTFTGCWGWVWVCEWLELQQ